MTPAERKRAIKQVKQLNLQAWRLWAMTASLLDKVDPQHVRGGEHRDLLPPRPDLEEAR